MLTVVAWGASFAAARVAPTPELSQVLGRFDAVQESIRSLSADFTMTTESALLKDKIVARGRVFLTKPDAVRWEFDSPEEMRFVIDHNVYTGYFPEQNRAERRDIQRWREQLFRLLGLGQVSSELDRFYEISLGAAAPAVPGAFCLVLEPRKKRVKKKVETVRFWVDGSSYLPVEVEYSTREGDRRVIAFHKMVVNPELAASLYTVDLPADVKVTEGFSAFSSFGPAPTR